jgi:hypothetical protein
MEFSAKEMAYLYTILRMAQPTAPPDMRADTDALIDKIAAYYQRKYPHDYRLAKEDIEFLQTQMDPLGPHSH